MTYIYRILNLVNGKCYVGKTDRDVQTRWLEHWHKAAGGSESGLHRAFRKYGMDNFKIETLESVPSEQGSEREQYWIKYYNAYTEGYNETLGGEGRLKYNPNDILESYQKLHNQKEVARQLGISTDLVQDVLRRNNVYILSAAEVAREQGQAVRQLDKSGQIIAEYPSLRAAAFAIKGEGGGVITHIKQACTGKRWTAYGFRWEFIEK